MVSDNRLGDWWQVGTVLAKAVGVPRTTLISAVDAGHIPWKLLGDRRTVVVRLSDVLRWKEGRR